MNSYLEVVIALIACIVYYGAGLYAMARLESIFFCEFGIEDILAAFVWPFVVFTAATVFFFIWCVDKGTGKKEVN